MRFLLIDASRDENDNPTDSNGDVINEIGDGSVLGRSFPCETPNEPDCEPDLPPYDIEFDPEGLSDDVGSVEFTVTSTAPIDDLVVVDNTAPYAVSLAQDGVYEDPEILNTPAERIMVTAEVFSRDDAEGRSLGTFEIFFEVTNEEGVQTEFDRAPEEAETESEVEVEVSAANGQATAAVALAAASGAVGARALVGAVTSGSVSLRALDAAGDPVPPGTPADGGIVFVAPAGGTPTSGPPPSPTTVTLAEAEAEVEVEVESEAEAETDPGAAAAAAGTAVTLGGTGVDAYLGPNGRPVAVAAESTLAVDAASSTSTSLSADSYVR